MSSDRIIQKPSDPQPEPPLDERVRREMQSTHDLRVMDVPGACASLLRLDYDERLFQRNYRRPVLVACCEVAGVRARLAMQAGRLRDVGVDLVASAANRILTVGAEPLLLMYHTAGEALEPEQRLAVIEGLADGCRQASCALLEAPVAEVGQVARAGSSTPAPGTAEDRAGPVDTEGAERAARLEPLDVVVFMVGVCQYSRLILGRRMIEAGDDVIGLAGAGLHGAAFELAVRALLDERRMSLDAGVEQVAGTVADVLLTPGRVHVGPVLRVLRYYRRKRVVRGMACVSGSGLPAALSRVLPDGMGVRLSREAWPVPAVYDFLAGQGVGYEDAWQRSDMGVGMALFVRPAFTQSIVRQLARQGQQARRIGTVTRGGASVEVV